jgi:hypothetical protein
VCGRPKARGCSRSLAETVGSSPAGAWMSVPCECSVLSCRGLCEELEGHPEKSLCVI